MGFLFLGLLASQLLVKLIDEKFILLDKLALNRVSYLSLTTHQETGSCEVCLHDSAQSTLQHDQGIIKGLLSPESRTSSIGVWLSIEPKCEEAVLVAPLKPERYSHHTKMRSFFLFKDAMQEADFKRICRMVNYVKHSAHC